MTDSRNTRKENDTMGDVLVPADALYGAQTQRAVENFPVSGQRLPRYFVAAMAHLKAACAEVNLALKPARMTPELCRSIQDACAEVADGRHDAHFPIDVFQTGSGTSTNMNANEVLANLANRKAGGALGVYAPVHPNDHVNMGQSSNDIIPTVSHLSALLAVHRDLKPALDQLATSLEKKAKEFDPIVKLGRTHLMDAVPVRMGQEFGGYAMQVRKGWEQIDRASKGLEELAIGGTATGTGINSHPEFAKRVCAILAKKLGLPVREARDHFEAQGSRDDMVMVSGALKGLACSLTKIANDIRWMGSGPFGGLAELQIPDLQPGSSIMPGKVNPVMSEMLTQIAAQVIGNDAAITIGAQGGNFELNVMIPVMTHNLLGSIAILANGSRLFAARCVDGLKANAEKCAELLEKSPISATALNPIIGYERAAKLVKEALAKKVSVKKLAVEQGLIKAEDADRIFDFRKMTEPGETT
ncbi:MAG TPA: class II fumarate hydratase [Planctomycetota bacterium]|nr:class II fumarate hydratase [Planctomycetota bacterium]